MEPGGAELGFRRHYGAVFGYFRRRVDTHEQAEDLTQAVFSDAVRHGETLDRRSNLVPWLMRVASHRLSDHRRRERRYTELHIDEDRLADHPRRDLAVALVDGLRELPQADQRALTLKLIAGCSFAEIARDLGTSEAAARMRLMRALQRLRDSLEQKGISP